MLKKLMISLLFIVILSGCKSTSDSIEPPTNLSFENGILTWDSIDQAVSYTIDIDGTFYDSDESFFDLNFLDDGTHIVKVLASNYEQISEYSPDFSIVLSRDLSSPTNLSIDLGILSWDAVESVTSYTVYINNVAVAHPIVPMITLYTLSILVNQIYEIQVEANFGPRVTEKTDILLYNTYQDLGVNIQETYTLNDRIPITTSYEASFTLEHIEVNNLFVSRELYVQNVSEIQIAPNLFEYLGVGVHQLHILTTMGIINLEVTVINPDNPYLNSESTIDFMNQDMTFDFNLVGGSFVSLTGNDITTDDYSFLESRLTVNASYINQLIAINPSIESVTLVYELQKDSQIVTDNIVINIPQ